MHGFTFLVLATVAGIGFTATAPKAKAQVGVEIGVALSAPTATMTPRRITVLRLATTVQNGLTGTDSLALVRGSMALMNSRVTWITGYIQSTATRAQRQNAARKPSRQSVSIVRISKETKCEMDVGT